MIYGYITVDICIFYLHEFEIPFKYLIWIEVDSKQRTEFHLREIYTMKKSSWFNQLSALWKCNAQTVWWMYILILSSSRRIYWGSTNGHCVQALLHYTNCPVNWSERKSIESLFKVSWADAQAPKSPDNNQNCHYTLSSTWTPQIQALSLKWDSLMISFESGQNKICNTDMLAYDYRITFN